MPKHRYETIEKLRARQQEKRLILGDPDVIGAMEEEMSGSYSVKFKAGAQQPGICRAAGRLKYIEALLIKLGDEMKRAV